MAQHFRRRHPTVHWRMMHGPSAGSLAPHRELPEYYAPAEDKSKFVRRIFDETARDYDRVERMMALGSGSWYRRQALRRAGLGEGMRVLDVATGTGLVAREEVGIVGRASLVTGVDPSAGMLSHAVTALAIPAVLGVGEQLPFPDDTYDFLSMGYAMRHLADLRVAYREFYRVLKPGGKVCILEITKPTGNVGLAALRVYMRHVVPMLTRVLTGRVSSQRIWRYYWDTIERCVPPPEVTGALHQAGFDDVEHRTQLGIFTEYTATKPPGPQTNPHFSKGTS